MFLDSHFMIFIYPSLCNMLGLADFENLLQHSLDHIQNDCQPFEALVSSFVIQFFIVRRIKGSKMSSSCFKNMKRRNSDNMTQV